jgi:hypothetical protein
MPAGPGIRKSLSGLGTGSARCHRYVRKEAGMICKHYMYVVALVDLQLW